MQTRSPHQVLRRLRSSRSWQLLWRPLRITGWTKSSAFTARFTCSYASKDCCWQPHVREDCAALRRTGWVAHAMHDLGSAEGLPVSGLHLMQHMLPTAGRLREAGGA